MPNPRPKRRFGPFGRARPAETKTSAARPLIALHGQGRPVWTPRSYEALAREGYGRNVIAFRCVRMIAEAAASLPLVAKVEAGAGAAERWDRLLGRPNPSQSATELFEALYGHLQVAGNAYFEAAITGGAIRELYVLRPDRMKVLLGPQGWPDGFEYAVDGRKTRFVRDASGFLPILHLRQFHPTHDHYGMSPLEAAAASIDVHNAGQAWNKALLDNAARPSGALVYAGPDGAATLTDEQFERLKTQFVEEHAGPLAAGRPLLLEGGLDWKPMSHSPADMDFVEAKHVAAREIALAFGVPPMLLGIPGDNTYANYREANLAFWRQTVAPLARKTADALSAWLSPQWGSLRLEPDFDKAPAFQPERERLWARLDGARFLTTAEKRELAGLPPLSEKDKQLESVE